MMDQIESQMGLTENIASICKATDSNTCFPTNYEPANHNKGENTKLHFKKFS
jgi:hypothetical protein